MKSVQYGYFDRWTCEYHPTGLALGIHIMPVTNVLTDLYSQFNPYNTAYDINIDDKDISQNTFLPFWDKLFDIT